MNRYSAITALTIFVAATTPVNAGEDIEGVCEAFKSNNDVAEADCTCIADAISETPDVEDEFVALESMEDYENSSDELKAAISQCHA